MIDNNEKPPINIEQTVFQIPECCREGWDSCKHVPKRQKKQKTNVGL